MNADHRPENSSGTDWSQRSSSFQRGWKIVLATTMTGPRFPTGSNSTAVMLFLLRLVEEPWWFIPSWSKAKSEKKEIFDLDSADAKTHVCRFSCEEAWEACRAPSLIDGFVGKAKWFRRIRQLVNHFLMASSFIFLIHRHAFPDDLAPLSQSSTNVFARSCAVSGKFSELLSNGRHQQEWPPGHSCWCRRSQRKRHPDRFQGPYSICTKRTFLKHRAITICQ